MTSYMYYPGCSMEAAAAPTANRSKGSASPSESPSKRSTTELLRRHRVREPEHDPGLRHDRPQPGIAAGEKKDASPSSRLQRLLPQPGQGGPLHGPAARAQRPRQRRASAPAGCTTTRARSRFATSSRSSSTTSAWTRSRRRSRSPSPASRSRPTSAAWSPARRGRCLHEPRAAERPRPPAPSPRRRGRGLPAQDRVLRRHMTQVAPKVGLELIRRLVSEAESARP